MSNEKMSADEALAVLKANAKDARRWWVSEWSSATADGATGLSNRALAAVAGLSNLQGVE